MREIPLISIASVNACQNRCSHCAHQGIRDDDPAHLPAMPLPCGWCWANPTVPKINETHQQRAMP
jgi:hypothetical protein